MHSPKEGEKHVDSLLSKHNGRKHNQHRIMKNSRNTFSDAREFSFFSLLHSYCIIIILQLSGSFRMFCGWCGTILLGWGGFQISNSSTFWLSDSIMNYLCIQKIRVLAIWRWETLDIFTGLSQILLWGGVETLMVLSSYFYHGEICTL